MPGGGGDVGCQGEGQGVILELERVEVMSGEGAYEEVVFDG